LLDKEGNLTFDKEVVLGERNSINLKKTNRITLYEGFMSSGVLEMFVTTNVRH